MAYSFDDKRQDAERAFNAAQRYHGELAEIYRYFTPFRQSTAERGVAVSGAGAGASEGGRRTEFMFDGTGPSAAFAFASNMKADWMPALEEFFALQNGPLYVADNAPERAEQLQMVARIVHALTTKIRATATDEMFSDLFAGTGALCMPQGDRRRKIIRGFSVPTTEIALENGPWGDVERWFWRRNYKARHMEQAFADAKFGDKLASAIRQDRNLDILVTDFTYYDHREGEFVREVWSQHCDKAPFETERMRTSPWITPRMFVVPGESFGRGLAHLGLPFVKTVNKARELALRAAAFALLGLWTRRHDGVFNPETAAMVPGAMWKVASNGSGGMGRSIERLDIPHNFDISTVIIKDEREQIRRVLLDDELPEITDRVRSPTEIAGRMRRYEKNRGGATTRLAFELVTPFVQRAIDIIEQLGVLPTRLSVDDVLTQAVITAPAAAAQKTDKVERMVSWLQMVVGLVGPQAMALSAKIEEIVPQLGRDLGVDEKFIRKKTEAEHLKMLIEQAVQQAVAQEREAQKAAPQAPAPAGPEVAPEQQYMNGGF